MNRAKLEALRARSAGGEIGGTPHMSELLDAILEAPEGETETARDLRTEWDVTLKALATAHHDLAKMTAERDAARTERDKARAATEEERKWRFEQQNAHVRANNTVAELRAKIARIRAETEE